MWDTVVSRKHTIKKIFPFGNDATEVMLYGTVDLGLRTGESKSIDWAAHAQLDCSGEGCKMKFYQVYLVRIHRMERVLCTDTLLGYGCGCRL